MNLFASINARRPGCSCIGLASLNCLCVFPDEIASDAEEKMLGTGFYPIFSADQGPSGLRLGAPSVGMASLTGAPLQSFHDNTNG